MSYAPKGASLPARFKKAATQSNFKQRPRDRLVTIESYNLPDKSMIAAHEVYDPKTGETRTIKIEARINPDKAGTGNRGVSDKWNGNMIDERMEKALSPGSRVALEACETERKLQKNGEEVSLMRCNWVASPPDPSPHKSFTGIITVNQHNDRIVGVQKWRARGISPANDEDAITALGEELEKIMSEYKEGLRPVSLGVQFRTLVSIKRDGTDAYEMVDSSPPFDWIRAERDGEGKVLKEGHPLDRDHLERYLDGYLDYVYGAQDMSDPDAPQGLIADGIVDKDAQIDVEVMVYDAYQAAPLSEHMAIKNERHPLSRLANVLIKYGQNDETSYVGKNWAVDGIIFLTGDQAPKARGENWKARNLVSRVFTNGFQGNLHQLVQASDGKRVYPHPKLDRVRETAPAAAQNSFAPTGSDAAPTAPAQNIQLTAPADQGMFDEDDDTANYFTEATQSAVVEAPISGGDISFDDDADAGFAEAPAESARESSSEDERKDEGRKSSGRDRFSRDRNRSV